VTNKYMRGNALDSAVFQRLFTLIDEDGKAKAPQAAQLMALCTLANLFSNSAMASYAAVHEGVVTLAQNASRSAKTPVRSMGATLLFNCSLFFPRSEEEDAVVSTLSALSSAIPEEKDATCCFRMAEALAHTVFCNSGACSLLGMLDFDPGQPPDTFPNDAKIAAVCQDLAVLMALNEEDEAEYVD